MRQVFLVSLFLTVLIFPALLYIKNPSYWLKPVMAKNLFYDLAFGGGKSSLSKTTAVLGLMTALTVLLAGSVLYLPVAGYFLSHFATLFVAAAVAISLRGGFFVILASSLLLLSLFPKQAPVLFFLDGPLGYVIGWGIATAKSRWQTLLLAAAGLCAGVVILSYVIGIPTFTGVTRGLSLELAVMAIAAYALIYAWAWITLIADFFQFLKRILT